MPYITKAERSDNLRVQKPDNIGALNFLVTTLVVEYLQRKGLKYENWAAVRGMLEDVGDETRRRLINPYEDKKIKLNGDVYYPPVALIMEGNTSDV